MAGFKFVRSLGGGNDVTNNNAQLAASLTVEKGDALNLSAGELAVAGTTELVQAIAAEAATSGTTDIVKPAVVRVTDNQVWGCAITPPIDELATSGSTTTAVITETTSDNDYDGGYIYVKELNEHRVIDDSQETSGSTTFTVIEPFSSAVTAGMTVRAVPFGIGGSPRLNAAGDAVDCAVASKTGGKLQVEKIDLARKEVEVRFLQA